MSLANKRLAAGLLGAMGLAVLATSALAQNATGQGATAINSKKASISRNISSSYFSRPSTPEPQQARSGDVAFQYFRGSLGDGLLVWHPSTGAHMVYGDLLEFYEENGGIDGFGVPTSDPMTGPGAGCASPDTKLRQLFLAAGGSGRGSISTGRTGAGPSVIGVNRSEQRSICVGSGGSYEGTRTAS